MTAVVLKLDSKVLRNRKVKAKSGGQHSVFGHATACYTRNLVRWLRLHKQTPLFLPLELTTVQEE